MKKRILSLIAGSCVMLASTAVFAQTTALSQIPPTGEQIREWRAKDAAAARDEAKAAREQALKAQREQELKARIDALQAKVDALRSGEKR